MKTRQYPWVVLFWTIFAMHAPATVFYVDVNSTNPTPPYASWDTAANKTYVVFSKSIFGYKLVPMLLIKFVKLNQEFF